MKSSFLVFLLTFIFAACNASEKQPEVQLGPNKSSTGSGAGSTIDDSAVQENQEKSNTDVGSGTSLPSSDESLDTEEGAGSTPEAFEDETTGDEYSDETNESLKEMEETQTEEQVDGY